MANPYKEIFQAPGSIAFSVSGLIARSPMAMISVGLVTMLSMIGDSYGTAGYIAATYVIANALIAPQLARLADRHGQIIVALIGAGIAVTALCLLLIAALNHMPLWLLLILAAFVGFIPSFGAFVRARWSRLYSGTPLLRSAFAFESIVDEMIFIIGPIIAIFLTTHFFPAAGPLAAAGLLLVGTLLFAMQTKTAPKPMARSKETHSPVITNPQIILLILILLAVGIIFGAVEVGAVAYADSFGVKQYAFVPLVTYATGSFIAGIIYGALKTRMPLHRQFLYLVIFIAVATLPLLLVFNLWSFSVVLFIAGVACSPTIIVSMALVEAILPAARLTEGMTWAVTGLSIGVAIGTVIAGRLIDAYNAETGFRFSIVAGFIALALTLAGYRFLKIKSTMREI